MELTLLAGCWLKLGIHLTKMICHFMETRVQTSFSLRHATQSLLYFHKKCHLFCHLSYFFCANNIHVLHEWCTEFKCSAPFGKALSVVSTDLVSAAVYSYILKCMDHDLWKAGIMAGSEQQYGLVKISPSCVSKVI